jgi:branched-chain amino acid transport system permease protein
VLLDLGINGLFQGVSIALAALGFAIIWFASKEFHFLYGTMLAASGFGVYALTEAGVPLVLAFVIVIAVAAVVGAVLERGFYLKLGSPLSVLLFSFGLAVILQNILQIIFGPQDVVLSQVDMVATRIEIIPGTGIMRRANDVLSLVALIVLWIGLSFLMLRTKLGLALQSVMKDPEAAQYVGVRPARMRMYAYAIGSGIGALAGGISMLGFGVRPTTGFEVMLFAFMATFLAAGNLVLVPVWGLLVGTLPSLLAWQLPTNFTTLITFALMLLYVVFRKDVGRLRFGTRRPPQVKPGGSGAGG